MMVWFLVLAALGIWHIGDNPAILKALSPHYALAFMLGHPAIAFIALGSVVLCVTGAEALYADMGHFGKRPIRLAWFGMAMPALVLNYFGQGAMLLVYPEKVGNPFYEMAPTWALYPLIGLATCATVIASQALITARVLGHQAGDAARLPAAAAHRPHLGARDRADLPAVRQLGPVRRHRHRRRLLRLEQQAGRGLRHHGDDRHADHDDDDLLRRPLRLEVPVVAGHRSPPASSSSSTSRSSSANIVKVFDGGWFPLLIGALMYTLMMTWKQGRKLMGERLRDDAIDLPSFLESVFISPPTRVDGTAVFLVADQGLTPNAMLHNLKHNKVLHERNLFVTVRHHEVPWIAEAERCEIEALGHDCWQVTLHFGFKNEPDVPAGARAAARLAAASSTTWTPPTSCRATSSSRPSAAAWPTGARSSSPACTATPPRPPTSCACRRTASSSSARRSRSEHARRSAPAGRLDDLAASRDVSRSSAVTAGFVAVLVGFTSSVAIVFQAAQSLGATPAQAASWMWALGWGMGLTTLLPSLWLRKPVMIAWSTPGAAVLAVAGASGGFGMAEATGAFIVCAALILLAGASGGSSG